MGSQSDSTPEVAEPVYKFEIDEECFVIYRQIQHKERWYRSKILKRKTEKNSKLDEGKPVNKYFVHYKGWNPRWDIWQREEFLLKDTAKNREHAEKLHNGEFDPPSPVKKVRESQSLVSPTVEIPQRKRKLKSDQKEKMSSGSSESKELESKQDSHRQNEILRQSQTQNRPSKDSVYDNLSFNNMKMNLVVKKCGKSEARESFVRESDAFDVVEAPLDCDDVLRGDNFHSELTTELMEQVELEMVKMRSYVPNLPFKVSICDIFDNYIHWHLVHEIMVGKGISRKTVMFNEDLLSINSRPMSRAQSISSIPLSFSQELTRAIQICQTIVNLMYNSNWFYCNLLYDSEVKYFQNILKSAKWGPEEPPNDPNYKNLPAVDYYGRRRNSTTTNFSSSNNNNRNQSLPATPDNQNGPGSLFSTKNSTSKNSSSHKESATTFKKTSTRGSILQRQSNIKRNINWFLPESQAELRKICETRLHNLELKDHILWLFDEPKNDGDTISSFLRPNFNKDPSDLWLPPGVPHIY